MRIAIISAPARRGRVPDYVNGLQKGMESMGHRVDVLDAWADNGLRLPGYEYVAICAEAVSPFSGTMSEALPKILSSAGSLGGKKSAAFLKKKGPFITKALINLMGAMEKEGMLINWSEIIINTPHAEALGKRIGA
jgi:hypothetical protein